MWLIGGRTAMDRYKISAQSLKLCLLCPKYRDMGFEYHYSKTKEIPEGIRIKVTYRP